MVHELNDYTVSYPDELYRDFISRYKEAGLEELEPLITIPERFANLEKLTPFIKIHLRKWILLKSEGQLSQISNYYDSDRFDYTDTKFLHEDGSPANFGDVVEILGQERPIHFTTAGWLPRNTTAQAAAAKIVALEAKKSILRNPRISVNASHRVA